MSRPKPPPEYDTFLDWFVQNRNTKPGQIGDTMVVMPPWAQPLERHLEATKCARAELFTLRAEAIVLRALRDAYKADHDSAEHEIDAFLGKPTDIEESGLPARVRRLIAELTQARDRCAAWEKNANAAAAGFAHAAAERDRLRAELDDLREWKQDTLAAYDRAINSPCPDEKHCTCVPALRVERDRLREALQMAREYVPPIFTAWHEAVTQQLGEPG